MSKEVVREPKLLNVLVFSDTSNASLCHEQYLLKPRYKTRYMYLFLDNAIYLSKTCVPTSHEARYPIQENFSGGKKKNKKNSPPFSPKTWFYLLQTAEILGNQGPKPSGRNHQGMFLTHCHRSWPTTIAGVPGLFPLPLVFPKANSITNWKNPAVKFSPHGAECLSPLQEYTS